MYIHVYVYVCVILAGIGALARIAFCNFPSTRHATMKATTMTTTTTTTMSTTTTTQFDVFQIHKYTHTHLRDETNERAKMENTKIVNENDNIETQPIQPISICEKKKKKKVNTYMHTYILHSHILLFTLANTPAQSKSI